MKTENKMNEDIDVISKAKISETAVEKSEYQTGDMPVVGVDAAVRPGTTAGDRLPPRPAARPQQSAAASASPMEAKDDPPPLRNTTAPSTG